METKGEGSGWTDANLIRLNPWFVTGFTDAECCLGLYIYKNKNYKTGWSINLVFQISLHEKDINLLEQFKLYFGVSALATPPSLRELATPALAIANPFLLDL